MGGVDLLDSMLGLYRIGIRSKKWPNKIFFHFLDLCVVNAWILWRKNSDVYMALFDFKMAVAEHFCKVGKTYNKKKGRPASNTGTPKSTKRTSDSGPSTPTSIQQKKVKKSLARPTPLNEVRKDSVDHLPEWKSARQQCHNDCKFRSFVFCSKCGVYLCLNKDRNCFMSFHT